MSYTVEINKIDKQTWSDLLPQFDDATIYQTWSLGAINWGRKNLNHVLLKKDGDIVAMAQVNLKKVPVINVGIATVYWGPIWKRADTEADIDILSTMIRELKNEYVVKKGFLLRIWPSGFENDGRMIMSIFENAGFKQCRFVMPYRTLRLSLLPSLEDLRKNLAQKWRNQLNSAERLSLHIRDGNDDELYDIFLSLLEEMLSRKRFLQGVNYHKYRLIQNDLQDFLKMNIVVCEYDGKAVSAAVCSAIGDTGIYLLGATGNQGLKLNSANLLHWHLIRWLKERNCRWYDLGGIDPENNPGVYHFKRGIAGKTGEDIVHCGQMYSYGNMKGYILHSVESIRKSFLN